VVRLVTRAEWRRELAALETAGVVTEVLPIAG
jgi:hypothetical protein